MIQLAVLVPMLALSAATPQTVSAEQTIAPVQAPTAAAGIFRGVSVPTQVM